MEDTTKFHCPGKVFGNAYIVVFLCNYMVLEPLKILKQSCKASSFIISSSAHLKICSTLLKKLNNLQFLFFCVCKIYSYSFKYIHLCGYSFSECTGTNEIRQVFLTTEKDTNKTFIQRNFVRQHIFSFQTLNFSLQMKIIMFNMSLTFTNEFHKHLGIQCRE